MARKPIPGSDEGEWGDILNAYLDVAHSSDGSLKDGSISEAKLSSSVQTKLNGSGGGSVPADGSVTTAKLEDGAVTNVKVATNAAIAQSKIANLTSDLADKASATHTHNASAITAGTVDAARLGTGTASAGTVLFGDGTWKTAPAGGGVPDDGSVTNAKVATNAAIAQSKIANLTTDLAGKADSTHNHTIANVTNLQTTLDGKADASHTHPAPSLDLDDLTDVNTGGATAGQVLTWQGAQWAAADQTGGTGGGTSDHGALTGLTDDDHTQYHNDARGDARYYTQSQVDTALGGKADSTHTHGAAAINSGVLSPARLGTGTASSGTVLFGDGTWKTAPSGGGGVPDDGSVTDVKVAAGAAIAQSKIANLTTDLAGKADTTHTHTIANVTNLQTTLDGKAASNATVNLTGAQTVAGVKTFSSSPVVPAPTTDMQVATKKYVDDNAGGGGGGGNSLTVASINATDYGAGFSDRTQGYMVPANQWVICDTTDGGMGVTLPASTAGAWVKVKKLTNDTNAVVVWPPVGQQISAGSMTSNTISINVYGTSSDFWGDGSIWHMA